MTCTAFFLSYPYSMLPIATPRLSVSPPVPAFASGHRVECTAATWRTSCASRSGDLDRAATLLALTTYLAKRALLLYLAPSRTFCRALDAVVALVAAMGVTVGGSGV